MSMNSENSKITFKPNILIKGVYIFVLYGMCICILKNYFKTQFFQLLAPAIHEKSKNNIFMIASDSFPNLYK